MPEGETTPGEQGQGEGSGTPPPTPPAAKFTQEDVDRINAETRRKAEEAAAKRLLQELGIEDVEKGKAALAAAKAAEDASKSELDKAREELERLRVEKETISARERNTLVKAELKSALRDAGINPQRIDGALRLAPLGEVQVADDGTVAGVAEVVRAVKEASPEWFGAAGQPFTAPEATPGSGSAEFQWATATPEERDAELRKLGVQRTVSFRK